MLSAPPCPASGKQGRLGKEPERVRLKAVVHPLRYFLDWHRSWPIALSYANNQSSAECSSAPWSQIEFRPAKQTFVAQQRTRTRHIVFAKKRILPIGLRR